MKILYKIATWGDDIGLLSMYQKLKLDFPLISLKVKKISSVQILDSLEQEFSFDFVYFEINDLTLKFFIEEMKLYREILSLYPKFFTIMSSISNKEKKELVRLIEYYFGHSLLQIAYSDDYKQFCFEFIEFLLNIPKKRVVFSDGKVIEIDFQKKSISFIGERRKCYLSCSENELFKQLFLSWEENRKYVQELKLKKVSGSKSISVLISRLRKKLHFLSAFSKEVISIGNDKKRGYFLEEKPK